MTRLERIAEGLHYERAAITATATLMLAAVEAGWTRTEIGMHHQTVARRVETAPARFGDAQPAGWWSSRRLRADLPSRATSSAWPSTSGEWLTRAEAAHFAQCDVETIWNWRRRGLLPNTQHPSPNVYLYLRADLRRVMRAPRHNNRGVDYRALGTQIEASPA